MSATFVQGVSSVPKVNQTRLKLEERIALARRYHAGEAAQALAEAYGVSRRHVTRIAREEKGEGREIRDPSVSVSFRAATSEIAGFDSEWQARGFANRSQALQALVRARCGLLDLMRVDFQAFSEAVLSAQDVVQAGRVLAKAVSRGKLRLSRADRETLTALLDLAEETRRTLLAMKATARARRGQGWRTGTSPAEPTVARGSCERSSSDLKRASAPLQTSRTQTTSNLIEARNRSACRV